MRTWHKAIIVKNAHHPLIALATLLAVNAQHMCIMGNGHSFKICNSCLVLNLAFGHRICSVLEN